MMALHGSRSKGRSESKGTFLGLSRLVNSLICPKDSPLFLLVSLSDHRRIELE